MQKFDLFFFTKKIFYEKSFLLSNHFSKSPRLILMSIPASELTPMYDFSVLRTLRKREAMTLQALSEASGVSMAVISKLERNQCKADIDTLFKLARAFGMSASELLGIAESRLAQRAEAQAYAAHGFSFTKIAYGNAACFYAHAKKNATLSRPEIHVNDHEICWVLKGTLEIKFAHENHTLKKGDALQFDAIHEHTYRAITDVELMLVHIRKANRF